MTHIHEFFAGSKGKSGHKALRKEGEATAVDSVRTMIAVIEQHTHSTPKPRQIAKILRISRSHALRCFRVIGVTLTQPTTGTEWRVYAEFPEYEVSNVGEIRRTTFRYNSRAGRLMKSSKDKSGYVNAHLIDAHGTMRTVKVHQLVCTLFTGERPLGCETRHLNGIRDDNRAENLCWGTHTENMTDMKQHGTVCGFASLSPERRSEVAQKKVAAKSPEQRRADALKVCEARARNRAAGITAPANAYRTPDQNIEYARRAAEARRHNRAKRLAKSDSISFE